MTSVAWAMLAVGLFGGFLFCLGLMALLRGNDRPQVVGAVRPRCDLCDVAWAEPCTDDDLDLCPGCRESLDAAARRSR